tara:strand:- start:2305 stop:3276 length:972 start_codon:yes stop_codon:yes gene_type:complete
MSSEQEALSHLNATALQGPNVMLQRIELVNNTNGSGTTLNYDGSSFCINLPCGLFSGRNPIPLSRNNGVGGLMVEIQLAPDSQVLFSDDESSTGLTDAYYELSHLKLIAEGQVVAPNTSVGNTFEYNSIHSYFNSINSTNAILNFQLGLSNVLGVFCNFVPSSYINNFKNNGMLTTPILNVGDSVAPIKQIIFTRAGIRQPLQYNLDTNVKDNSLILSADPQLIKNWVNGIKPYYELRHTQISPATSGRRIPAVPWSVQGAGAMFGVGVSYDMISGQGVNFQNTNFGLSMETGLNTDNPNAVYMFVRNKSTLVFTPNGVQVLN